ncbi:MAG: LptF/LptG family permease, partial [Bacteroidales bacterium]|nr:LptF/LptG family permease [Bacteroidales bacterium]
MKKIDIYLFKNYIGLFFMTFFVVIFIFLMQFFWKYVDDLVGKGLEL